jgi:hypothetical protein
VNHHLVPITDNLCLFENKNMNKEKFHWKPDLPALSTDSSSFDSCEASVLSCSSEEPINNDV